MFKKQLLLVLMAFSFTSPVLAADIKVFKSPYCGCCGEWVRHMEEHGHTVDVEHMDDLDALKKMAGVPGDLESCHTAMVEGYVLEGHVPARDVERLLAERPKATGLSVPGMPHGSPGMETGRKDPYNVVLFGADNGYEIFSSN